MKIAITGASGYIGRVLSPLLLADGHLLRLLTHTAHDLGEATCIQGDLLQKDSLELLVRDAEAVIHLGAVISLADKPDERAFQVNTTGTRLLLEAALQAGVKRFIYVSSVAAFQQAPYDEPMDESRGPAAGPERYYDHSKAIAQAIALEYNGKGIEVVVLAPSAVLGPFDRKPSLLGRAIIDLYKGNMPALVRGGVDFVDVRDVAAAIAAALRGGAPGGVYLLSGKWVSLQGLSKQVAKRRLPVVPAWLVLAALPLVRLLPGLPYYTRQSMYNLIYSNRKIDSSKAKADLSFRPRPFEETIKDTIDWFKQNGYI